MPTSRTRHFTTFLPFHTFKGSTGLVSLSYTKRLTLACRLFLNSIMTTITPHIFLGINGLPGAGKLTIERALVELMGAKEVTLIDKHQLPVDAKIPGDHPEY
jgi:ABC-type dipeptide/oligopeptide/nickel transport system ATPase subunit